MSPMRRLRGEAPTPEWKGGYAPYDLVKELFIAVGVVALLAILLTVLFSSPDDRPSTIAQWSRQLPVDFETAAVAELGGTSGTAEYGPPYNHNAKGQHAAFLYPQKWLGVSHPINTANDYVINPLKTIPANPALESSLATYQAALVGGERALQRGVRGDRLQRVDHVVIRGVDRVTDPQPFLRVEEGGVLALGVVVIGRPVFGGAAGATKLGHRSGLKIDRQLTRPLRDRARAIIGRGEENGQQDRQ